LSALVADALREFGFEQDPELDADLEDPGGTYVALWIALAGGEVAGSVALRDLGDRAYKLKRMYLRHGGGDGRGAASLRVRGFRAVAGRRGSAAGTAAPGVRA
jgi:hypothetical protein